MMWEQYERIMRSSRCMSLHLEEEEFSPFNVCVRIDKTLLYKLLYIMLYYYIKWEFTKSDSTVNTLPEILSQPTTQLTKPAVTAGKHSDKTLSVRTGPCGETCFNL